MFILSFLTNKYKNKMPTQAQTGEQIFETIYGIVEPAALAWAKKYALLEIPILIKDITALEARAKGMFKFLVVDGEQDAISLLNMVLIYCQR